MKRSSGNINYLDIFPASNVAYNDLALHYSSGAQKEGGWRIKQIAIAMYIVLFFFLSTAVIRSSWAFVCDWRDPILFSLSLMSKKRKKKITSFAPSESTI